MVTNRTRLLRVRTRVKASLKAVALRAGFVVLPQTHLHNLVRQISAAHSEAFVKVPDIDGRIRLLAELIGTDVSQAMHMIHWLHATQGVPGDVCEFGVAQGATSALFAHELLSVGDPRELWLYDSFAGLPAPTEEDHMIDDVLGLGSMEAYAGQMTLPRASVERRLRRVGYPLARSHIHSGFITQETGQEILPKAISFAYIDFDLYQPIKDALRLVDSRLASGGVIVIDDYGYFSTGARTAVDEFASAWPDRYHVTVGPVWAGHFAVLQRSSTGPTR